MEASGPGRQVGAPQGAGSAEAMEGDGYEGRFGVSEDTRAGSWQAGTREAEREGEDLGGGGEGGPGPP